MTDPVFYGCGFPYRAVGDLPGKLIVLEGTDGVGRSTQIGLLGSGWKIAGVCCLRYRITAFRINTGWIGPGESGSYAGTSSHEPVLRY